jgi:hypothetical protein
MAKQQLAEPHFYLIEGGWEPVNKVLSTIKLSGTILSPTQIGVTWDTVPGNQPATYHNRLALWQNQGIPWGLNPLQEHKIIKNTPSGDQLFDTALQRKPYVIAYGVSSLDDKQHGAKSWAATVQFNPGSAIGVPFVTEIDVAGVGNDSISARFSTPAGNNPKANGNWVGLWEGAVVTFDGTNKIATVPVSSTTSDGFLTLNGLSLKIDTTYTLGYAVGPLASDLAAWMTFTTASF